MPIAPTPVRPAAVPVRARVVATAAPAAPAHKTSDTVSAVGVAVMDTSVVALVGGFLLSAFAPAGVRALALAANIAMAAGGAGIVASFGLGKWLEKLDAEGR